MKKSIIISCLILTGILTACSAKEYVNQNTYELSVGDQLELYYTTNSCCYYCFNGEELQHLEYIDDRVMIPYEDGCDGCDQTEAFVFEAKSVGVDTIYMALVEGGEDCRIDKSSAQKYVVTVK